MDETILIIDDDDSTHLILENILKKEFSLLRAKSAQEGIDILSVKPADLIISDIHMPGISGLDFLESLMADAEKKNIPILIMTALPTVEKEQKALDLGAADFINKDLFHTKPEEVLNRVRAKLISNFEYPDLTEKLSVDTKKLSNILMASTVSGDFFKTSRKFVIELKKSFNFDYVSQWTITGQTTSLIMCLGEVQPDKYSAADLEQEETFQNFLQTKEPYLCNHVFEEEGSILTEFSKTHKLPAEIGLPLFALDEKKYLKNNRSVPEGTPLFGFIVFKRNTLFTTKEFKLLKKLFARAGTILWRLYRDI